MVNAVISRIQRLGVKRRMWKWVWIIPVLLFAACCISFWPAGPVSVRVFDPALKIEMVRVSRGTTNYGVYHVEEDNRPLTIINSRVHRQLYKWHMIKPPPYIPPDMKWLSQQDAPGDWLVMFGRCADRDIAQSGGFTVETTNGVILCRQCAVAHGRSGKGFLTNTFGTMNFLPKNLHGVFLLKTHGRTNVLAKLTIR
ncbi:MAG TPA: hypothetical protein VL361_27025 [Candidatus Limnocylindrales bacterium]|jgi:hypothetical protein|nr:hypothetical protein [Candidatus Limnocylindrales bacterium]